MYTELGHFAFIITIVLVCIQAYQLVPLYVTKTYQRTTHEFTSYLVFGQFIFLTFSFSSLFYAYIISDFSLINVIENSHSNQPLVYKISGVWGNHEGSILLWCWVLSFYSFLMASISRVLPTRLYTSIFSIQSLILGFFLIFTLTTSNPFLKVLFFTPDGSELNPILQDPGLIIHPPLIYFGYLGFSIPFSLTIAALLEEVINSQVNNFLRIFSLISWSFLTLGITLGSWWAYYELGWGGWWFWDPVENASLMPWLVGTALLHSVAISYKRKLLQKSTFLLAITAFIFSLIGTFFVRSGLLSSVHSFANDGSRGLLIFVFLSFICLFSVSVYQLKIERLNIKSLDLYLNREGVVVLQNILLLTVCLTVCIGTFAPVLFNFFISRNISIGLPFYNSTIVPLIAPILILMAISPFLKPALGNKGIQSTILHSSYKYFILLYMPIACIILGYVFIEDPTVPVVGYIFIFLSCLLFISLLFSSINVLGLKKLIRNKSMLISHLGVALFIFAVTISSIWQIEAIQLLRPGDQVELANYIYTFRGINNIEGPNYYSLYGNFSITSEANEYLTTLFPEKRFYSVQGIYSTKAAIHTNFLADLYAIIGDGNLSHGWYTRFFYNPLMPYVWVSGIVIASGGVISLYNISKKRK